MGTRGWTTCSRGFNTFWPTLHFRVCGTSNAERLWCEHPESGPSLRGLLREGVWIRITEGPLWQSKETVLEVCGESDSRKGGSPTLWERIHQCFGMPGDGSLPTFSSTHCGGKASSLYSVINQVRWHLEYTAEPMWVGEKKGGAVDHRAEVKSTERKEPCQSLDCLHPWYHPSGRQMASNFDGPSSEVPQGGMEDGWSFGKASLQRRQVLLR